MRKLQIQQQDQLHQKRLQLMQSIAHRHTHWQQLHQELEQLRKLNRELSRKQNRTRELRSKKESKDPPPP